MSADNGIYIFPLIRESKTRYVVRYMGAVDNCTYQPDHTDGYNHKWMEEAFGFSKLKNTETTASLDMAYRIATRIEKQIGFLEYGICIMAPYHIE